MRKRINEITLLLKSMVINKNINYFLVPPVLFDEAWYLEMNLDVRDSGIDPYIHYLRNGWKENRNPNRYFDIPYYLERSPEIKGKNIDPLFHYINRGWKQGKNPSAEFSVQEYLNEMPAVSEAGEEPLQHFLKHGEVGFAKEENAELSLVDRGLEVPTGGDHYRAFVGPPEYYDLVAAMVFNLLTCLGLREQHAVLDIGCGSLRVGRLLIPYLLPGNYIGVEPEEWVVQDGIKKELGEEFVKMRRARFIYADRLDAREQSYQADFSFAQSVFSHAPKQMILDWLSDIEFHMSPQGVFLGTYFEGEQDHQGEDWVYPGITEFREKSIQAMVEANGLNFKALQWAHPRQKWFAAYKDGYDPALLNSWPITWNRLINQIETPIYPMPSD